MVAKGYAGGAAETELSVLLAQGATSATLVNGTSWPTGASSKKFVITIDRGTATEEKILCTSRTGDTPATIAIDTRGYDGTTDQEHAQGSPVVHMFDALSAQEANDHTNDTTRDDHTQYHNTARHAAVSHTSGMLATGAVTTAKIADENVTTGKIAADAIDGTKIADDAVNSEHIASGAIDLDHMSANSVDSDQYVDGSIDTAHIAASQITNALMADDAIDSAEIADGAIDLIHMSANSVDSDQYVDGSIDAIHIGDPELAAIAGLTSAANKVARFTGSGTAEVIDILTTTYTPTVRVGTTTVTVGNGDTYGWYIKVANGYIGGAGFVRGSTTNLNSGTGAWSLSLPTNAGGSEFATGMGDQPVGAAYIQDGGGFTGTATINFLTADRAHVFEGTLAQFVGTADGWIVSAGEGFGITFVIVA